MVYVKCKSCGEEFPAPVDLTEEAWVAQNIIDQVEASCPHCGAVATYSKPDFYWR